MQDIADHLQNDAGTSPLTDTQLAHASSRPVPDECVYFIRGGDFVKIGYSADLFVRFIDLQTSCPFDLEIMGDIPGGRSVEAKVHFKFGALHVRGEWFRYHPEIVAYIDLHRSRRCKPKRKPPKAINMAKPRGWQPIQTAPKDGTRVLLHAAQVGSSDPKTWNRWLVLSGYYDVASSAWRSDGSTPGGPFFKAAYWMELPDKPE